MTLTMIVQNFVGRVVMCHDVEIHFTFVTQNLNYITVFTKEAPKRTARLSLSIE